MKSYIYIFLYSAYMDLEYHEFRYSEMQDAEEINTICILK